MLFVKLPICFPWWKVLLIFLFCCCSRWSWHRLLCWTLIPRRRRCKIAALRCMRIIKFSLLLFQHLFLIMKLSYFLLLSLYQLHRAIGIINHLKKLLTYTLFHSCDKFSALNIFPYGCFTVKSSRNVNFHGVGNLLDFFDTVIIDVSLHLMNWITWINSSDCSLIFRIFENQTNYRINVPYHDIGLVIKMSWRVKRMVNYHIRR